MKKSRRTNRKKKDQVASSLSDLKKQVRKKVTDGQAISPNGKRTELEAREIQIKIADLETKAEQAASASKKRKSPMMAQKVLKQTEALKRKLKP